MIFYKLEMSRGIRLISFMGARRWDFGGQGKNCGMKKIGTKTFIHMLNYVFHKMILLLNLPIQQTNSYS
jgi:hypothetical protein